LYNPSATQAVNLTGWKLVATDGSPSIDLSGTIPASGYFVIAASSSVFNDLTPNLTFTGTLSNDGEILRLLDSSGTVVDTANSDGGGWPAGSPSPNYASMERSGSVADSSSAWFTFAGTTVVAHDKNNNAIKGTPGRANWATTVTPTRTVTSTSATVARTATRTQTPAPTATPFGRPVLNEFLPRPGYDWNQDGKVDVYDEFIEIKNIGGISVSLKDWKLDDEPDSGSAPFSLPEVTLQAGERILLYGLQTNILLSDGGDTVRLLNPAGAVFDAYTYSVVKVTDRSICRIIDGNGSWYKDCIPSPNFTNTREGVVPSMPGGSDVLSATCNLPDTLPPDFLFAECRGYGAGIWDSFFWDQFGWQGIKYLFSGRWETFVE
ncbi:MAG: lamin tail domain-containing protein, partial [Chloroflexi bacterium]|nr:lamin tail domain-containing protein [Chloroflexota bacterium]